MTRPVHPLQPPIYITWMGMAMTLRGMLQLNHPPEQAFTAVLSLAANTADGVKAEAASQRSKKSSTAWRERLPAALSDEMGILDSINVEKMVEGER